MLDSCLSDTDWDRQAFFCTHQIANREGPSARNQTQRAVLHHGAVDSKALVLDRTIEILRRTRDQGVVLRSARRCQLNMRSDHEDGVVIEDLNLGVVF
jgi:hypothetical protein